jgi:hypothetical protein
MTIMKTAALFLGLVLVALFLLELVARGQLKYANSVELSES